jgi:hypothetical protein
MDALDGKTAGQLPESLAQGGKALRRLDGVSAGRQTRPGDLPGSAAKPADPMLS